MVECATGTRQPTRLSGNQWQPASPDVDHDGFLEWYYKYASHGALCACCRDACQENSYSPLRLWETLRFTLDVFASPLMLT